MEKSNAVNFCMSIWTAALVLNDDCSDWVFPEVNCITKASSSELSCEVLVYQFCLFHFNSLSFDSISVRVGENEALVP